MKLSNTLWEWITKNDLSIRQLLNLAFVPKRTFEEVRDGMNRLAAKKRLYIITELEEFKLSNTEESAYLKKKQSDSLTEIDEAIAFFFKARWINEKKLPDITHQIMPNSKTYQDRNLIREKLAPKLGKVIELSGDTLGKTIQMLKRELDSNDLERVNRFKEKHADSIRKLKTLSGLFYQSNPVKAYSDYKAVQDNLPL